ncbi:hypothetical protein BSL78_25449 [Apostichopus japonicus]|uniref:Band 7 domain-containing protein n=1 Tax=Stichopus japonicus TaxID=307972 RepID=A0A2G8JPM4_STIJA|nr:hypothetical protein BSL78_25449 [Apostichopus japonicus]
MASNKVKSNNTVDSEQSLIATDNEESLGCCVYLLVFFSYLLVCCTFPFSLCVCIKMVQEYERAVIFRLGRLLPGGAKGPGIFFILPCIDNYVKVDLRTISFDVPPQESEDPYQGQRNRRCRCSRLLRVCNPTVSITNVENYQRSTRLLAATTLRNVLGTKTLQDVLAERESISATQSSNLDGLPTHGV